MGLTREAVKVKADGARVSLPTMAGVQIKSVARVVLPRPVRHWLLVWQQRLSCWPPSGLVRFGSFRRVTPVSRHFGFGRGRSVDRYYIERFLSRYANDIAGHVLEIGDDTYTKQFGSERVSASQVLHVRDGNPKATLVADLTRDDHLQSNMFDCIICTQTLQYIYDVKAAIKTLHRILKPHGVLLVTIPGISQISRFDMDRWGEHWRFTSLSAHRLFSEIFPNDQVRVEAHGNVLAAVAFLHGLAAEELSPRELEYRDPDYEVSITVRAIKAHNGDR